MNAINSVILEGNMAHSGRWPDKNLYFRVASARYVKAEDGYETSYTHVLCRATGILASKIESEYPKGSAVRIVGRLENLNADVVGIVIEFIERKASAPLKIVEEQNKMIVHQPEEEQVSQAEEEPDPAPEHKYSEQELF